MKLRADHFRWAALLAAALLLLALRLYCASAYRVDSDEPQHLHVVWGVARGLVQYRDIFDNHSPLFHQLCAPLFRALGERPDILVLMRFAMVPLYFGSLGCIYWICSRLFSRPCGALAAALAGLHPRFFCTSLEFRPDNLWALVWLLLLCALLCARRPTARWFLAGFWLGTGFAISMKTTVMLLDLAGAGALTFLLFRKTLPWPAPSAWGKLAGCLLAGLAIVPGLLLLHFAAADALPNLAYCLVRHNLIAAAERVHAFGLRECAACAALAAILWWSAQIARSATARPVAIRRVFLLTAGGLYPVILFGFWPLVTREDFLALLPMVAMVSAPALLTALDKLRRAAPRPAWFATALPAALLAGELGAALHHVQPWHGRAEIQEQFVANMLRLTNPGDYVMDTKGETIYRNRPYYYVFEEMTRWKFKAQEIPDDIPEELIARSVCVAVRNGERYPARTARFLRANYIPVAHRLLVAGKILMPQPGQPLPFEVAIPANYTLIWKGPPGAALLDGKPCAPQTAARLEAGPHSLVLARGAGPVALIWANAVERGFLPFYRPSAEERRENTQAIHDNIL